MEALLREALQVPQVWGKLRALLQLHPPWQDLHWMIPSDPRWTEPWRSLVLLIHVENSPGWGAPHPPGPPWAPGHSLRPTTEIHCGKQIHWLLTPEKSPFFHLLRTSNDTGDLLQCKSFLILSCLLSSSTDKWEQIVKPHDSGDSELEIPPQKLLPTQPSMWMLCQQEHVNLSVLAFSVHPFESPENAVGIKMMK